jgi:hypothetical protein
MFNIKAEMVKTLKMVLHVSYATCVILEDPKHYKIKPSPGSSDLFNIGDLSRNIPSSIPIWRR